LYLFVWQTLKKSGYEQEKPLTNGLQGKPLLPTPKLSNQDIHSVSFDLTNAEDHLQNVVGSDC